MAEIKSLTCPNCGGSVQSHNVLGNIECSYCRSVLTIKGKGTDIHLAPLVKELKSVQIGVDRTASELAISRLKNEMNDISDVLDNMIEPKFNIRIMPSIVPGVLVWILISLLPLSSSISNGLGSIILLGFVVMGVKKQVEETLKAKRDADEMRNKGGDRIDELRRQLRVHQNIVSKV